nr:TIGR01777 family oxidoreductase [Microlunatus panaciterrae]
MLAGSSGFLGSALRVHLAEHGHEVVRLVRRPPATATEFRWDPAAGTVDQSALEDVDVVVNLGGAGIADRPWTQARREVILSSRRETTLTLSRALARHADTGARPALLQASGVAWYGTRSGPEPFTEDAPVADDWLAGVVQRWEDATRPATEAGLRVALLRTSPVMDGSGGPLKLMKLPFSLGLGARLGDGSQHMAMISLTDWLNAVSWIADHEDASGPHNLTLPQPCTNAEFTAALAAALHRPAALRAPALVLRTALGELADQLLGDQNIVPRRLLDEGFSFVAPDVETTVRVALGQRVNSPA